MPRLVAFPMKCVQGLLGSNTLNLGSGYFRCTHNFQSRLQGEVFLAEKFGSNFVIYYPKNDAASDQLVLLVAEVAS